MAKKGKYVTGAGLRVALESYLVSVAYTNQTVYSQLRKLA